MEQNKERKWKLYCHTNLINGKLYFGITSTSLKRRYSGSHRYQGCRHFNAAIQKYGWENFKHELIYDNLTKEEACEAEQMYIYFFSTQNPEKGYNIQSGGLHNGEMSEEARQHLVEINSGENSKTAKPVVVFDLNGNKVEEFILMKDAEQKYNTTIIRYNAKKHSRAINGFYFRWKSIIGDSDTMDADDFAHSPVHVLPKNFGFAHCRPVTMFDKKTGHRIKEYRKLKEVLDEFHIDGSHIWEKGYLVYQDYVFYFSDQVENVDCIDFSFLDIPINSGQKRINQYDQDGKLLHTYDSLREAAEKNNLSYKSMSQCANHKCRSSGGFVWRYVDDPIQFEKPKTASETRKENKNYNYKAVDQLDLKTGKVLRTFPSLTEAGKYCGISKEGILCVVRHRGNCVSAAGYGWKYHEE